MASNKGVRVYPSGIIMPSTMVAQNQEVEVSGNDAFKVMLDMVISEGSDSMAGAFELKTTELMLLEMNKHCSPLEFFVANLKHNPRNGPLMRKFLMETLDYLNGKGRAVPPHLVSEILEMPAINTERSAVPDKSIYESKADRIAYPTFDNRTMVVKWVSLENGVIDALWTYRTLFGSV